MCNGWVTGWVLAKKNWESERGGESIESYWGRKCKCFTVFSSVKHFAYGFSFYWKYFTVDQLFYRKTNIVKFENIKL